MESDDLPDEWNGWVYITAEEMRPSKVCYGRDGFSTKKVRNTFASFKDQNYISTYLLIGTAILDLAIRVFHVPYS